MATAARRRQNALSGKKREALLADFVRHVQETNQPEVFPGVSLTGTARDADIDLLLEFSVVRAKRPDKSMVPCSFCSPDSEKFLHHGWLAYFPADGALRLIGPRCGKRHLAGFEAAIESQREILEDERRRRYIRTNAAIVEHILSRLPDLMTAADQLRTFLAIMNKKLPALSKHLGQVAIAGTGLTLPVWEEVVSTDAEGNIRRDQIARQRKVADLFGGNIFKKAHLDPLAKLNRAKLMFQRNSPAKALGAIEAGDANILTYPNYWADALRLVRSAMETLDDARTFLAPHNLEGLTVWGTDVRCPHPYSFELSDGRFEIWHERTDVRAVNYIVADVFKRRFEPMPSLGKLETS